MYQFELEAIAVVGVILFPATLMADFARGTVRRSRTGVYVTEFFSELTLIVLAAVLLEVASTVDAHTLGEQAQRQGIGYMLTLIAFFSKVMSWCFGVLHEEVIEVKKPQIETKTWRDQAGVWFRSGLACAVVSAEIAMPVLILGY